MILIATQEKSSRSKKSHFFASRDEKNVVCLITNERQG